MYNKTSIMSIFPMITRRNTNKMNQRGY